MNRLIRSLVLPLALAAAAVVCGSQASGQDKAKAKGTPAPAKKDTPPSAPAGAVFELYKDGQGNFRFRLMDGETELAMSHKGYKSKADCQKAIEAIKLAAAKAKVEDQAK